MGPGTQAADREHCPPPRGRPDARRKDPEVRTTQQGMKIVSFTLATSESWNDKNSGERKERTEWHRVVVMSERLADVAERFLRKGSVPTWKARCRPASGPTRAARNGT
jgi:hypothetical protein